MPKMFGKISFGFSISGRLYVMVVAYAYHSTVAFTLKANPGATLQSELLLGSVLFSHAMPNSFRSEGHFSLASLLSLAVLIIVCQLLI